LIGALVLTPLAGRAARRYRWLDLPSDRKVHEGMVPRVGGVALYLAFFLPFGSVLFYQTAVLDLLHLDRRTLALVLGCTIALGLGLWDDVRGLNPRVKLLVQAVCGVIAYLGGIRILTVAVPGINDGWALGWLSLPATVFWFLLVMNAMNLIDGLDGLAAGVTMFASIVLLVLCVTSERLLEGMGFAALGGACLGFLRYNFNPASIFMGDSGSYFLGYMMAALSIVGSIKSQATVAILIPIIALGVPLMDALWAPVRRFVLGEAVFEPDRDHLHHRLLALGLTQRRAVLVMYGVTVALGGVALFLVHARDDRAALILLLVGAGIALGIRKLGYLEYLAMDKLVGWVRDVTDDMGIRRDRRTFLGRQVAIGQSRDMEEMWARVVDAARLLGVETVELKLLASEGKAGGGKACLWKSRNGHADPASLEAGRTLYVSLPLADGEHCVGHLCLSKDVVGSPLTPYTLRRIEQLRRAVLDALIRLRKNGGVPTPAPASAPAQLIADANGRTAPCVEPLAACGAPPALSPSQSTR
jgi:UDP-GlcNAc:undecaprenyl-phosphate GlcNAc-1-phosphate transferase